MHTRIKLAQLSDMCLIRSEYVRRSKCVDRICLRGVGCRSDLCRVALGKGAPKIGRSKSLKSPLVGGMVPDRPTVEPSFSSTARKRGFDRAFRRLLENGGLTGHIPISRKWGFYRALTRRLAVSRALYNLLTNSRALTRRHGGCQVPLRSFDKRSDHARALTRRHVGCQVL